MMAVGLETEYRLVGRYSRQQLCSLARKAVDGVLTNKHIHWFYEFPIELWVFPETSNRMLDNGSRLYNEVHCIEYSTAECLFPRDVVAVDKAGESVMAGFVSSINAEGFDVRIVKNNAGYGEGSNKFGFSNSCHENYGISPELFLLLTSPRKNVQQELWLAFLVTRIIFTGAGKIGPIVPAELKSLSTSLRSGERLLEYYDVSHVNNKWWFEISQRAPFLLDLMSHETTEFRPMINLRDEPHADPHSCRRLHVIVGDSNRSELSTFLKVGVSQIFLKMLESRFPLPQIFIDKPVVAIREVSADPELRKEIMTSRGKMTALEIQQEFFGAAYKFLEYDTHNVDPWKEVLKYWGMCLDTLGRDKFQLAGRLDWVTKYFLYLVERNSNRYTSWEDIRGLDFNYCLLGDGDLYSELVVSRQAKTFITESDRLTMQSRPPQNTRAKVRMELIRQYWEDVDQVNWNLVQFKDGTKHFLNYPLES